MRTPIRWLQYLIQEQKVLMLYDTTTIELIFQFSVVIEISMIISALPCAGPSGLPTRTPAVERALICFFTP